MQNDPVGTVGEGGARLAGIAEDDLRQSVADDEFAARILQHDIEEPQRPAQRVAERRGMQHAVAEQGEASSAHRPPAHAEEFVVELGRDRKPQCSVYFRRYGLLDHRRQPECLKHRLRRLSHPAQAFERLLDKSRRNHAPLDFGHRRLLVVAKLSEIMNSLVIACNSRDDI